MALRFNIWDRDLRIALMQRDLFAGLKAQLIKAQLIKAHLSATIYTYAR
jgi:hypothetical protein